MVTVTRQSDGGQGARPARPHPGHRPRPVPAGRLHRDGRRRHAAAHRRHRPGRRGARPRRRGPADDAGGGDGRVRGRAHAGHGEPERGPVRREQLHRRRAGRAGQHAEGRWRSTASRCFRLRRHAHPAGRAAVVVRHRGRRGARRRRAGRRDEHHRQQGLQDEPAGRVQGGLGQSADHHDRCVHPHRGGRAVRPARGRRRHRAGARRRPRADVRHGRPDHRRPTSRTRHRPRERAPMSQQPGAHPAASSGLEPARRRRPVRPATSAAAGGRDARCDPGCAPVRAPGAGPSLPTPVLDVTVATFERDRPAVDDGARGGRPVDAEIACQPAVLGPDGRHRRGARRAARARARSTSTPSRRSRRRSACSRCPP